MNAIISIAKKEIMDNIRNKWIIILSIIFAILILIISYFGSQGMSQDWSTLEITIEGMKGLVILIIPIISLILGYSSIVGEIEKGSMSSLLSYPTNRYEIILGKFIGLGSVITTTILIGFGIGGIIVTINAPASDYVSYFVFLGISILLGLTFLSLSLFLSTLFKSRTTAMGIAIFLWIFLAILWQIIIAGVLFALVLSGTADEGIVDLFFGAQLINPLMTLMFFNNPNVNPYLILLSLLSWTIIPLLLTFLIFKRKDI